MMGKMGQGIAPSKVSGDRSTLQRLGWVDYAKGIGIFWVVVGHVLRGLVSSDLLESSASRFIDQWIYAFHMPLFFFLSGLFLVRSAAKPFKSFLRDKLSTIAYPYVLWSLLQGLLQIVASRHTSQVVSFADLGRIIYEPIQQFWFLYTLFVILLIYAVMHKFPLGQRRSLLPPAIAFAVFSILLYGAHLANISFGNWGVLYLVRRHAIYTALGAIVGSSILFRLGDTKPPILILTALGGYFGVAGAVALQLDKNGWLIPAIALLGSAASVAIALLLEQLNILRFIKQWGLFSLEIFVVHTIVIAVTRIALQKLGLRDPLLHFLIETLVGIYIPIALAVMCRRYKFPYLFRWRDRGVVG
ncbi:MAG: acyltransferase [Drouetiella hepatica Uher 2000/2452]|jgi:fucose 4-O-acetylase-like acetyltransferase|uniref:Acyltransferase n=1 Tax=Drouetiella hepatica Uher 2000/2452 TaxID=904376 RepID=A0A951UPA5_9CYAN|nr:acyltransferase [Drouetiella hepatica Uher 2000/2452]